MSVVGGVKLSNPSSPIDSEDSPTSNKSARGSFWRWVSGHVLNGFVVWIVLTVGLLLTLWLWNAARGELAQAEQEAFDARVSEVSEEIVNRMGVYEQVLRGGVGLFESSDSVTRTEWKAYVASLKLAEKYPGILGFGFSVRIPAADLDAHLSTIRAEGFPDYVVRPPGTRAEYTPVIYLEPFTVTNQKAFGFDMFSESVRRAAMERARDIGETTMSSKIVLVQDANTEGNPGILMYLPYYKNGLPHDTLAQRRANLVGYVFAPFRVNDLMSGILESHTPSAEMDLDVEVYDGTAQSADSLLYNNDGILRALGAEPSGSLTATRSIDLYGQTWSLYFTALPGFYAGFFDQTIPVIILLVGTVLSVLLSGLIWMFVTRGRRTLELANRLTGDLGDSEERWKFALEGAGDGVWDWNPQTDKALFSKRWKEMVGYAESEFPDTGAAWIEHLHPDDKDRVLTNVQEYFVSNRARYSVEFRMRCKDGSWKWIMARGKLISRDSDGNPLRIIGTHTDITERIEAQDEILRLNTDLVRADGVKDQFIEDMNHELRTPLTSIIGYMEVLIGDVDSGVEPKFASSLKTVQRNALRLQLLIENLMHASGAKIDDTHLVVSTQDVGHLLGEVVTSLQLGADHSGVEVTLRLDSPASDLFIDGDVHQLEQVITNLVHNAIKYTPREGKVTIVARRAHTDGDYVEVTVTDTGIGISREDFPKVFERFFRASTATQASIPGFGLGLSLAHSIVHAHHGTITFDSTVGEGTVFTVRLPMKFIPTGPPDETT